MLYTEILNDNKDFLTLYKRGRFTASKYTVIYVRSNGKPYNRLGITAGKKIGNAVKRNRAKRVIYSAFRACEELISPGYDFVIVARTRILSAKSTDVARSLEKILDTANIAPQEKI